MLALAFFAVLVLVLALPPGPAALAEAPRARDDGSAGPQPTARLRLLPQRRRRSRHRRRACPKRSTASLTTSAAPLARSLGPDRRGPPPGPAQAMARARPSVRGPPLDGHRRKPAQPARRRPVRGARGVVLRQPGPLLRQGLAGPDLRRRLRRGAGVHRPRIRHRYPMAGTDPGAQGVRPGRCTPGLAPVLARALQPDRGDHRPGGREGPPEGPGRVDHPGNCPGERRPQGLGLRPAPPRLNGRQFHRHQEDPLHLPSGGGCPGPGRSLCDRHRLCAIR